MAYNSSIMFALAFILITIVFLIMYFVKRGKVIKLLKQTTEGAVQSSITSATSIIESTKRMLWYIGISYVTLGLAILFEGISGQLGSKVLDMMFVAFSVIFFIVGIFMTSYGILAMYNKREQKYGTMEKATLATICNLADGKKLLVFVPNKLVGINELANVEKISKETLAKFKQAGGTALDFCVVEDASEYRIGAQYLVYAILLRVRYVGIKTTFISQNSIEATVVNIEPKQETPDVTADTNTQSNEHPNTTTKKSSKKSTKDDKPTTKKAKV